MGYPGSSSADSSDAALIEGSWSEPGVFGAIFDRHFDAVRGYLARRVGPGRADDLASSTFVVAFERRRRFRREATTARPWLLGIATNLLRNERRAEQRALELVGRLGSGEPVSAPDDVAEFSRVGEVLATLDPDQRDVLLLYAWEELSYEEIATALGVPVGTVRSRLSRGRTALRSLLGERADLDSPRREMNG
ncbi:MAG TPA: RNA polymerase sigma factor [Solirubrobacteraceae bacterium]|jgi:RNA polymerase sigma-70 factor (ECF subfamily)